MVRVRATIMAYTNYVLSACQVLARLHGMYMYLLSLQAKETYDIVQQILFTRKDRRYNTQRQQSNTTTHFYKSNPLL